jgi:Putative esterase
VPMDTTPCIKVYLDGNCPLGHCVYANSDNNGPWGDALTQEFIPLLEKTYRCNGALLMKGHSSGGWACLWLQIHYPKLFTGCNASAPDYVDFRSFNRNDFYQKVANPSADSSHPRALTGLLEDVLFRGEQSMSFAAVFSPRAPDGMPMTLYNRKIGKIDTTVFNHWKQYDLSLYLRNNWPLLKKDLAGKIRISVGNEDTYHLNYAVEKMEEMSKSIGADIVFAYYPGDHYTVTTPAYRHDQEKWLEDKYQEWLKNHPEALE